MFNSNGLSLSDIAAVTGRNNNGDGFADGNGWWVLIILFALFESLLCMTSIIFLAVGLFAICGLRLRRVMAKLIILFILSAILPGSIIIVELRLVSCSTLLRLLYAVKTCQNIALKLTLS